PKPNAQSLFAGLNRSQPFTFSLWASFTPSGAGRKKAVGSATGPRLLFDKFVDSLHNISRVGHSYAMSHAQHGTSERTPAICSCIPTHCRDLLLWRRTLQS